MTPAERSIRMRTNLVVLTPGDRGYQDWADRRELLRLLDEERARIGAPSPDAVAAALVADPTIIGRARVQPAEAGRIAAALLAALR